MENQHFLHGADLEPNHRAATSTSQILTIRAPCPPLEAVGEGGTHNRILKTPPAVWKKVPKSSRVMQFLSFYNLALSLRSTRCFL